MGVMRHYYPRFKLPKTLTPPEERRLLKTLRAQGTIRDQALLTVALGTGLRLREIAGLNVGDVWQVGVGVVWKVPLDPEITKGKRGGMAYLPATVRKEIGRLLRWKRRVGEPLEERSPLFLSRQGRRLCLRQIQVMFRQWQGAARFETLYPFHALRHTSITKVYRATRDLYLTQRFARHASPLTTTIYTHPTDEELYKSLRRLRA